MDAKQQALNTVAQKHGYPDWNTLWWEGEITIDIMEDALEEYGEMCRVNGYDQGYGDARTDCKIEKEYQRTEDILNRK